MPVDDVAIPAPGLPATAPVAAAVGRTPRRRRRTPGVFWYWAALVALLAGGAAWVLLGVRAADMRIAAFTRVPLPQGGRITLPHAGTYVISYEAPQATRDNLPVFQVRARAVTRSLKVRLRADTSHTEYASGPVDGVAVLDLTVSGPGTVFLNGPHAPQVPGGSRLAVGGALPGFLATVMPRIGLMLAGIAGLVLIATARSWAAVRRARHPPARS